MKIREISAERSHLKKNQMEMSEMKNARSRMRISFYGLKRVKNGGGPLNLKASQQHLSKLNTNSKKE